MHYIKMIFLCPHITHQKILPPKIYHSLIFLFKKYLSLRSDLIASRKLDEPANPLRRHQGFISNQNTYTE